MTDIWQNLLEQARTMHADHPDIRAFCDFPDDLKRQQMLPHSIPASDLMVYDTGLVSETPYCGFRDGFIACAPQARWRQTYKGTNIGNDFLDRFGCYELIGQEGVFHSTQMRSFVVYAPRGPCIIHGITTRRKSFIWCWRVRPNSGSMAKTAKPFAPVKPPITPQ